jgi:isopenicillin-N N-acyltransferase-like protein
MQQLRSFTSSVLPPLERGIEFGERHAADIARTSASYRRLFTARATRPFDVDAWAERAWQRIQELAPWAAPEIQGIAEGAGVPVREVAAVNARTEMLAIADPTGTGECSSVVVLPPDGPPVAVQTWDWYDAMRDNWLHWRIPRPDGRVVETVTEFGMLAKIGVARTAEGRGIGVLLNMLHHSEDGAEEIGHPVHLLSRQILDQANDLDEALVIAKSASTSASTSLTLVEPAGRAVSVELSPGGPGMLEPEDGILVRTNHFVTPDRAAGCLADSIGPSSRIRRRTLLDAFATTRPRSAEDVIEAMHDHREVGGVCAHPDESMDPLLWHATLATVSLDPVNGTLDVTPGGPCARP